MSSEPLWVNVCTPERAIVFDPCAFCVPSARVDASPIDDFYTYIASVLPIGTEKALSTEPTLGRLLLLALVSGVEAYFRSFLSRVIYICPASRIAASQHTLSLASVHYYGMRDLGLGLLEGVAFSTEGEIAKYTQKLTGISWKGGSSLEVAVCDFESLSQFRHAAVHARGELNSRNVHALKIPAPVKRQSLVLPFCQVQNAAGICLNVVQAYNRHLFRELVQRWIGEGILSWKWRRDRTYFTRLFALVKSTRDGVGPSNAYRAYVSIKGTILKKRAGVKG